MAKKRIHEIAKEQGMSAKDVLAKLQAAGHDVKAAASTIEEAEAVKALGGKPAPNGAAKAPAQPRPVKPAAQRPVKPGAPRPVPPAPRAVKPARPAAKGAPPAAPKAPSRTFDPEPDQEPLSLRRRDPAEAQRAPLPPPPSAAPIRPAGSRPVRPAPPAAPAPPARPATPPAARPAPPAAKAPAAKAPPVQEPAAPAAPPAAKPAAGPKVVEPKPAPPAPAPQRPAPQAREGGRPGQPSRGGGDRRPRRQDRPAAPRAALGLNAPAPSSEPIRPVADRPRPVRPTQDEQPAAAAAPTDTEGKEEKKPEVGVEPAKGLGPKIISVPEPPARPTRDETKSQPSRPGGRPTRGGVGGEGGPGGGRRRVVIDSAAGRKPGQGGPPSGPPRRPPRGRRRRRRPMMEETPAALDVNAMTHTDLVRINSGSTVKDVAEYLGVPVPEIIKRLMSMGELATLTQTLSDDHIELIAAELGKDVKIVHVGDEVEEAPVYDDSDAELEERPPVVTIMGHVDHGKTSLLDAIRETEVVAGEAGGITQHIGAYQVHHGDKLVTFLDTPGHEAFTAMRARGAKVTDIAVIVVAADDGVKPQTREAIDHARAADVPIVVAVNKIDKEGADPTRVRTEMTQLNLQPAEWGGDTEYVDVSAKTKDGLDNLIETILVVSEIQELKANADTAPSGVVIESKLDPGRGPVATVLVQRGTLEVGDAIVAGAHPGRVRAMVDHYGERVEAAGPGDPVEVLGFESVPSAGEAFRGVESDREARRLAQERATRLKTEQLARRSGRKVSFEDVFRRAKEGELKSLPLVIKGDVAGSVEALEDEIARLPQDEVQVDVLSSGVGGITESDVMLAAASEAVIIGFNVRPVGAARDLADREGVEVRTYSIIYKALDELRAAMEGLLEPEEVEEQVGSVEVRQTFKASKIGTIAGSYVTDGKVRRGAKVRVVRDGMVLADTTVDTLRRFNDDAREVSAGYECGIVLANFQDIREGDVLEVYETRKVERELQPS